MGPPKWSDSQTASLRPGAVSHGLRDDVGAHGNARDHVGDLEQVTDSVATRWRFGGRLRVFPTQVTLAFTGGSLVRSWVLFASHSAAAPDPHSDCVSSVRGLRRPAERFMRLACGFRDAPRLIGPHACGYLCNDGARSHDARGAAAR